MREPILAKSGNRAVSSNSGIFGKEGRIAEAAGMNTRLEEEECRPENPLYAVN